MSGFNEHFDPFINGEGFFNLFYRCVALTLLTFMVNVKFHFHCFWSPVSPVVSLNFLFWNLLFVNFNEVFLKLSS